MTLDEMLRTHSREPLGMGVKAFPVQAAQAAGGDVAALGWHLLDDFYLPVMALRASAIEHNIERMARYCRGHGLQLAPHGKTTMAPQLFARQLAAGAWGMTAATTSQAQVMHRVGVRRVLLANQLVDIPALRWLAHTLCEDPAFEFLCLADSLEGVRRMEGVLASAEAPRPLRVLVEVGVVDGRSGARTDEEALDVAQAVNAAAHLQLDGLECFEGVLGSRRDTATLAGVDALIQRVAHLARTIDQRAGFSSVEQVVVSAGGSVFFDRLGPLTELTLTRPTTVVVRSGCYISHDSGTYDRVSPLGSQSGAPEPLRPALEVWGEVLSCPQPGLAIVNLGKRDGPYDSGLPIPVKLQRAGRRRVEPLDSAAITVTRLNDQHAFVDTSLHSLAVGDRLGCGISHPCTAFDKWRLLPVVDDEYRVCDVVRTFF